MARRLRIQFADAIYHVTSRGNRRERIFVDDVDRQRFLDLVAAAARRHEVQVLAYCLMGNHYHFVLRTRRANLAQVMRQVNGVYAQSFNRRHGHEGHLFQGRYHAVLVDREAYLLELCRYVELNPVRAGLVRSPAEWSWSSLRARLGHASSPEWLHSDEVLSMLLGRPIVDAQDRALAVARYVELLATAHGPSIWERALFDRMFLGDLLFVAKVKFLAAVGGGATGPPPQGAPA